MGPDTVLCCSDRVERPVPIHGGPHDSMMKEDYQCISKAFEDSFLAIPLEQHVRNCDHSFDDVDDVIDRSGRRP